MAVWSSVARSRHLRDRIDRGAVVVVDGQAVCTPRPAARTSASGSRSQPPRGPQIVSKRCRPSTDWTAVACSNASRAVMASQRLESAPTTRAEPNRRNPNSSSRSGGAGGADPETHTPTVTPTSGPPLGIRRTAIKYDANTATETSDGGCTACQFSNIGKRLMVSPLLLCYCFALQQREGPQ